MKQFGVDDQQREYQEFVIPTGQSYKAPVISLSRGDASWRLIS